MTDIYLLPVTDETRKRLQDYIDHRTAVIKEVTDILAERFGDNFAGSYRGDWWNRPWSVGLKKAPDDWTDSRCPPGFYRPKLSTKAGRADAEWLKNLPVIQTDAEWMGVKGPNVFNRPKVIGRFKKGPWAFVISDKQTFDRTGFEEITKARWELVLAQAAVDAEEQTDAD